MAGLEVSGLKNRFIRGLVQVVELLVTGELLRLNELFTTLVSELHDRSSRVDKLAGDKD